MGTNQKNTILVVDDEIKIRNILQDILQYKGYRILLAKDGEEALEKIHSEIIDLVILDLVMPGTNGMEVLKHIFIHHSLLPVIIISAHGNIPLAMEATQLGAVDFIEKPIDMHDILDRIKKYLSLSLETSKYFRKADEGFQRYGFIGISLSLDSIYHSIEQAAPTNVRVLITGETGTGKELVAKAIHNLSRRADNPFIKLNCAAIPSELIESELFGHRKGSFTGALNNKPGKFELANGGTLFLDEIGDMSLQTQSKVLRVLEEGEIQPVGSTHIQKINVRVLAATNKILEEEITKENFREDLYYRLNVVQINLPPLRERKEDIPYLINHFISIFCEEHNRKQKMISKRGKESLINLDWNGNIRELKNVIEKLVVFVEDDMIDLPHIQTILGFQNVNHIESDLTLRNARQQFERKYILSKLISNSWRVQEVARQLEIERTALYRKLKDLNIQLPNNS